MEQMYAIILICALAGSLYGVQYEVVVYTANEYWAGTDSKVFIQIYGEKGISDKIWLQSKPSSFEGDSVDKFNVNVRKDIGFITKLKIGHNNSGKSAGWLLKKVHIKTQSSDVLIFPVNKWLDTDTGHTTTVTSLGTTQKSCGIASSTRLIYGDDALPNQWPWQVQIQKLSLRSRSKHHCGATLIHPEYILTAAHCMDDSTKPMEDYVITLGEHDLSKQEGTEQIFKPSKIIIHPNWDRKTVNNDVAIVKLNKPAIINAKVKPVCLPQQGYHQGIDSKCVASGWGIDGNYEFPNILQQSLLPTTTNDLCSKLMTITSENLKITKNMLCAGQNGRLTCNGDSGGPLTCLNDRKQYVLQGSVSWGKATCNVLKFYAVFARIANYADWINENIGTVKYVNF